MKPIAVWIAMALVMCGCGRNIHRVDPHVGRVEGVSYEVVDFAPSDTSSAIMTLFLRNTNPYPVDVYLFHAIQGQDTLWVAQQTYVTTVYPIGLRLAPGERVFQQYFVQRSERTRIRLDGWRVYRLDSMKAPTTGRLAREHYRRLR